MPSTPPWVPFNRTSASISTALSAAVVSVVKNGFPVPAAKMTTRSFSKCRIALRRMYSSAICGMAIALWTRVGHTFVFQDVL